MAMAMRVVGEEEGEQRGDEDETSADERVSLTRD